MCYVLPLLLHAIDAEIITLNILKMLHQSAITFWLDLRHFLASGFHNFLR